MISPTTTVTGTLDGNFDPVGMATSVPAIPTGTTGVFALDANHAVPSYISPIVSPICRVPSGKTNMHSPASSISLAARMASKSASPRRTGKDPSERIAHPAAAGRNSESLPRYRTRRWLELPIKGPSRLDR